MGAGGRIVTERTYDHIIDEHFGEVRRDGKRVRIAAYDGTGRNWIQVGCTRVSYGALRRLWEMVQMKTEEIVLQEGEK